MQCSQELQQLLYHPMSIFTNFRKRMQIILLNLRIREIKSWFNKDVIKLFENKKKQVATINEMGTEIKEIQNELKINDEIFNCSLHDDEFPHKILTVNDNEVRVEKVLTPEEESKKRKMEEAKQERLNKQKTDITAKALNEMMHGTLETKDEAERLQDSIVKPYFLGDLTEDQWTDEQKQQVIEYNEKIEALKKAKEIRTKLLKTRLKTLKNDVSDICKQFDTNVNNLYNKRLNTMEDIYVHELMLIHLANDIIEYESSVKKLKFMDQDLQNLSEAQQKADDTYLKFNSKLEKLTYIKKKYIQKKNKTKHFTHSKKTLM